MIVILAAGTMLVLAVFMAFVLGWANKAFHVAVDPRQEAALEALPGANCGGCGYIGCSEYAEAVVAGHVPVDKCPVGGVSCATALAGILGVELDQSWPQRPVVHCGATYGDRLGRHDYRGEQTCTAADLVAGVQGCTYGCLGLGDCERACGFDAIHIIDGLARVDYERCVGCAACARACSRDIISMAPFKAEQMMVVACSNLDFGKDVKAVCKVGCTGCKLCQKHAGDLLEIEDNLPRIDYEAYDPAALESAETAIAKCPAKSLLMIGKPTERDLAAAAASQAPAIEKADPDTAAQDAQPRG